MIHTVAPSVKKFLQNSPETKGLRTAFTEGKLLSKPSRFGEGFQLIVECGGS